MKRDKAILHVVPLYYQKEEAEYIRNKRIITLYAWLRPKRYKKVLKKVKNGLLVTVFENYRKCLIQNCERSELRSHGQKLVENAKNSQNYGQTVFEIVKWDIFGNFQTIC